MLDLLNLIQDENGRLPVARKRARLSPLELNPSGILPCGQICARHMDRQLGCLYRLAHGSGLSRLSGTHDYLNESARLSKSPLKLE